MKQLLLALTLIVTFQAQAQDGRFAVVSNGDTVGLETISPRVQDKTPRLFITYDFEQRFCGDLGCYSRGLERTQTALIMRLELTGTRKDVGQIRKVKIANIRGDGEVDFVVPFTTQKIASKAARFFCFDAGSLISPGNSCEGVKSSVIIELH